MASLGEVLVSDIPTSYIRAGQMTLYRGITPSIISLLIAPIDGLDLPDATVQFRMGNTSFVFAHCTLASPFIRRRLDGQTLWSVHLVDRRWKWKYGSISGEYNRRHPDGALDVTTPNNIQSVSALMDLCLSSMGETGYDISLVSDTVYPYVNWQDVNPAQALQDICHRTAHEIVLSVNDKVEIYRSGQGASTINQINLHPKYRYLPRRLPGLLEAIGDPSIYQHRLRLEAVGSNVSFTQARVNQLAHAPGGSWSDQSIFSYPGVADEDQYALTLETLWRHYRVKGQANGALPVPGCNEDIASVDQYQLLPYTLDSETDINQFERQLPPYVSGDFWAYTDLPDNVDDERYVGPWSLLPERKLVAFEHPVFKTSSSGAYNEAELYLTAAYNVKSVDGKLVRVKRSQLAGGNAGTFQIIVPQVFASYRDIGNTEAEANAELDAYLDLFAPKFSARYSSELTYAGLYPITPDGVISSVSWRVAFNRAPLTMACEWEELDRTSLGPRGRERLL